MATLMQLGADVCRVALQHVESRLHHLHTVVGAARRGIRNTLFKGWLRKPKSSALVARHDAVAYAHSTIEAQMRLLADFAFIVQVCLHARACSAQGADGGRGMRCGRTMSWRWLRTSW